MMRALGRMLGWFNIARFVPELVTRGVIGLVFAQSGWGKLNHLPRTIEFFESLGIPNPVFQAYFVATVELVCGVAIFLGLATRLASIPLCVTMLVALVTAKRGDIEGLTSLFDLTEFLYIALMLWLIAYGSGRLSLDHLLRKRFKLK